MSIRDVSVVRNMLPFADKGTINREELIRERMPLADDLWIGPLEEDLSDAVMDACEPAGKNFKPVRQFGSWYAIVREDAPSEQGTQLRWDPDGRIRLAIQMSRLVHPTSIAYEYAARIATENDHVTRIIPAHKRGCGQTAHVARPGSDWLTKGHIPQIAALVDAYDHDALPVRVKSALFYYEYAAWSYYIDVRWPMLVTAAESLIHVEGEKDPKEPARYAGSTRVFVSRMLRIQEALAEHVLDEAELRDVYRERSGLAHGQDFSGLSPKNQDLYCKMEKCMSAALRRAIQDGAFANTFVSDGTVQSHLPLA